MSAKSMALILLTSLLTVGHFSLKVRLLLEVVGGFRVKVVAAFSHYLIAL